MKKHMTQLELTKTRRLIESGVIDVAEIQTRVFCHADVIQQVIDTYDIETPPEKPAPKKKAAAKKSKGAAAAAAELL